MNARLRAFLDHFGFGYEFNSSTATYKSGRFDAALLRILANYDKVMAVMLPTLGEERQQTYSPFLPVIPRSGKVLLAKVVAPRCGRGHHHLCRGRWQRRDRAGDGRRIASCNGSPTWACAGRRWAWITRCTART